MSENYTRIPYCKKDIIQGLLGIPLVISAAIFCADFVTSYSSTV